MDGATGTGGRHVMFVGRRGTRTSRLDGGVRAAEKVFAGRTLVADASTRMLGSTRGKPCQKVFRRPVRRRQGRRDVRERCCKSCLYVRFLDLILNYSWGEMGRNLGRNFFSPANGEALVCRRARGKTRTRIHSRTRGSRRARCRGGSCGFRRTS